MNFLQQFFRRSHPENNMRTTANNTPQLNNPQVVMVSGPTLLDNILQTMDRFLENEDNLVVQALGTIERRTNISKKYLARILLVFLFVYLIFSSAFLDTITRVVMYFYPSYRSYHKLKHSDIDRETLINIVKFWIFMGFFATVDSLFGSLIPLGIFLKGTIIIHCVLPENSPAIDLLNDHIVDPFYKYLEKNCHIQRLSSQYFDNFYANDDPHED